MFSLRPTSRPIAVVATHLTVASILILAIGGTARAVDIEWVIVGDPGNPADTEVMICCGDSVGTTGYGSVGYTYRISKYEITNAQYAEFLNAVAATDTYGLYHWQMRYSPFGGITQDGSAGAYTYGLRPGRENWPVDHLLFYDCLRFANWLHNEQPTGAQGNSTTEDGAYTITPEGIAANSITRNAGATVFLPSEDEWYKAAYYDTVLETYYDYPAGTDTQTTCVAPTATPNTANCWRDTFPDPGSYSDVGSYTGSASPNGIFDQGGNIDEWNEAIISGWGRGLRGRSFIHPSPGLAASYRSHGDPNPEHSNLIGFRVASALPAQVQVDIKPGSCPNSWNRESNGVLPVAILGTEEFDVTQIDVASVTIGRADGTGGSVAPNEGPGPHSEFEDVATPFEGEVCECHEAEGDGIFDLSLKFRTQDVADFLFVDDPNGALVPLVVSGALLNGTPFISSSDCVRLVPPGSPPNQVTVESAAGSWIDATPLDNQLDGGGFGWFQRTYPHTTVLTLTGPEGHDGNPFVGWKLDESDLVLGQSIELVVNNAEHTAKAVFKQTGSCGLGVELVLLLPALLWLHGRSRRRMQ